VSFSLVLALISGCFGCSPLCCSLCPLVVNYAQNIEPLAPYFCWYFAVQASRDEVKGNYALAYEELLTEAMLLDFLGLVRIFVVLCPIFWWFLWFKIRWYAIQMVRVTVISHGPSYTDG